MKRPLPAATKRRALSGALLSVLGAVPGVSPAVYESPDHVGQALIYPYYTVQSANGNAFNTYLSVMNNTAKAKALKVRFREGKNGREALSFNLYLSPNDTWTAALGPADASASSAAMLVTSDRSCTFPPIPSGGVAFNNFAYAGVSADGGPTSVDRTREGYFEIIEMATLPASLATAVTHNSAGIPVNCAAVQVSSAVVTPPLSASMGAPTGGLSGSFVLINVANGQSFSGNATALAQFSSTVLYSDPGSDQPTLASANPASATTLSRVPTTPSGPGLTMHGATYASGRDAVSATLMKSALVNEYVLDPATRSATDWVVTFPTKPFYVSPGTGGAVAPFSSNFTSTGSCEPIAFTFFNREEASAPDTGIGFPEPPPASFPSLCWSANVVSVERTPSVAGSKVLGSTNAVILTVNNYPNGWSALSFVGTNPAVTGLTSVAAAGQVVNLSTGASLSATTVNHLGLPAIGFMVRTLNNGLLNCTTFGGTAGICAGSYGALLEHRSNRYTRPQL